MKTLAVIVYLLIIINPLQSREIVISDTIKHFSIARFCEVATGKDMSIGVEKGLNFEYFSNSSFVFGKNKEVKWIKFILNNPSSHKRDLLLEVTNANLYDFKLYKVTDSVPSLIYTGGIKTPYTSREINHPNNLIPLLINAHDKEEYYLQIFPAYNANNFNLLLWDTSQRAQYRLKEYQNINIFFFTNIAFLLILAIVLISTKQKWQWSLFFYILFGVCYMYIELGLSFKNIWPSLPRLQQISSYCIANLYLIAGVMFFRGYFDTKKNLKKGDKALLVLIYGGVLLTIVCFVCLGFPSFSFRIVQSINSFFFIITGTVVLYALILLLIRKVNRIETIWFIVGFTPHAIAIVLTNMRQVGIMTADLELNILSNFPLFMWSIDFLNTMMWSMLWEVFCVLILMSYRFNILWQENAKMFFQLERQRVFSTNQLISSLEQERKRIAQELHDESGVQLSAIRMRITYLEEMIRDESQRTALLGIMEDLDKVSKEIRQISHNLMPITLSKLGLKAAIQELINNLKLAYAEISFELFQQYDESQLSQNHKLNIYRIVQELLNNAMKYAKATEINVQIIKDNGDVVLSIEDNGVGFNSKEDQKGMGLKSIQSRVQLLHGEFEVDTNVGKGSFFSIRLPLKVK